MTGAQLAMFVMLVGTMAGVWVSLFYLFPLVARTRFQNRAAMLRDECVDLVFAGRLPRSEPVDAFVALANVMATHPEEFSLSNVVAARLSLADFSDDRMDFELNSYSELTPEQRKTLHRLHDELNRAFSRKLMLGSVLGWLLLVISVASRLLRRFRKDPKRSAEPLPQHLAREYSALSERVPIKTRDCASARG
jgi:hypothetical protein